MKTISFEKLYNTEFHITQPIANVQYWAPRGNVYSAIGKPKISHTLLWFKNCSATITAKDGQVLEVAQNQMTYMAKGLEYKVEFNNTNTDKEDTVVVHFQMTDHTGEEIAPILKPIICIKEVDPALAANLDAFDADVLLQQGFRQQGNGLGYKAVQTLACVIFPNSKFFHVDLLSFSGEVVYII